MSIIIVINRVRDLSTISLPIFDLFLPIEFADTSMNGVGTCHTHSYPGSGCVDACNNLIIFSNLSSFTGVRWTVYATKPDFFTEQ